MAFDFSRKINWAYPPQTAEEWEYRKQWHAEAACRAKSGETVNRERIEAGADPLFTADRYEKYGEYPGNGRAS
jgi:hypothetical protein